jgi:hypothetical protein
MRQEFSSCQRPHENLIFSSQLGQRNLADQQWVRREGDMESESL